MGNAVCLSLLNGNEQPKASCYKRKQLFVFVAWYSELPKYHPCISIISAIILGILGLFDGDIVIL